MPLNYYECFGHPLDSPGLGEAFRKKECPFVGGTCTKTFKGGIINGACTLTNPSNGVPVPCCPKRMYGDGYRVLQDVVSTAWKEELPLVLQDGEFPSAGGFVIPFGQKQGKEIRVSYNDGSRTSRFSIDWILAKVDEDRNLDGFVAVEVQTIDTTGNYQREFLEIAEKHEPGVVASFGELGSDKGCNLNFENVNKRILTQLITKGHVLRRENLCSKGLFFICPTAVHERIMSRVGKLDDYPIQAGSVTFLSYSVDESSEEIPRPLRLDHTTTTTIDQLYLAFSSPKYLPPQGVYEDAIRKALLNRLKES